MNERCLLISYDHKPGPVIFSSPEKAHQIAAVLMERHYGAGWHRQDDSYFKSAARVSEPAVLVIFPLSLLMTERVNDNDFDFLLKGEK